MTLRLKSSAEDILGENPETPDDFAIKYGWLQGVYGYTDIVKLLVTEIRLLDISECRHSDTRRQEMLSDWEKAVQLDLASRALRG